MKLEALQDVAATVVNLDAYPLSWDYDLIAGLERGAIWVDLLRQEAFSRGQPLPRLFVAGFIHSSMIADLGCDPSKVLDEATLKIRFRTERHPDQRDLDVLWAWQVPEFVTCTAHCRSRLTAGGQTAIGLARLQLEWPANYRQRETWTPSTMSWEEWRRHVEARTPHA